MKGLSGPQDSGAWRFLWLCATGVVFLAACAALLGSGLPAPTRLLVSDTGLAGTVLAAALSCGVRRRRSTGRRRRAWTFLALAAASAFLCNLMILLVHLLALPEGWIDYSAPVLLLALVCATLGLTTFSGRPRRSTDLGRLIVDCAVITVALTLIVIMLIPEILTSRSGSALTLVLPLVDVAVLTYALLILVRVGHSQRLVLGLLCVSTALYALCDLAFLTLAAERQGFAYGSPLDVGWMAGSLLVALAALHPAAAQAPSVDPSAELASKVGTALMFLLVALATALGIAVGPGASAQASTVLWVGMVSAVAARQVLLIMDNDKLRKGLELMVADRTLELEHATRQSDLLLASVGEGIYGVDHVGRVTFVNPAGARALGATPLELVGVAAHGTFHHSDESSTSHSLETCYVTEAIRHGTVTNAETDVYGRIDGGQFPVEVTATPLSSAESLRGAVVVFRDITQRLEVDRLKSEFVSMVSHELRTPLTSIRGSLGLVAGGALGPVPAGAHRMVALALDSCARLTRLINDMLDIERIESGTMPMVIGDHRAAALIDTATAQLQLLAADAGVRLVVTEAGGTVHADADRAVQTLINLIGNAIKFSPPGGTVDVAALVRVTLVEFRIRDEGRGIPPDKLDRIFSRFEQVDSSDAREKGGSGLGLAISRSVVERLGGHIWAENRAATGAVFRFTLPRSASDDDPLTTARSVRQRISQEDRV